MAQLVEVKVPDMGNFKDVPVIEVFVKPGDKVKKEDSLITLESDKATMEVPSSASGVVKEVKVTLGDKVSEGSLIVVLEAAEAQIPPSHPLQKGGTTAAAPATTPPFEKGGPGGISPAPAAGSFAGKADIECEMLVLGAGPGGQTHDFRRDLHVVVVIGRGLGVGLERAVHHDRGEALADRGGAGGLFVAVIEMQAERDLRIHLLQRVDHLRQHDVVGIGTRAARSLDDDRRIAGRRRLHDGQALLHVVDVEARHAVAPFGGVVQQLPQCYPRHGGVLLSIRSLHELFCCSCDRRRRDAEFAVEHVRRRRRAEAGPTWGTQTDDVLEGAPAAACMTCHQSADSFGQAVLKGHAYQNGWEPKTIPNGRQTIIDAAK